MNAGLKYAIVALILTACGALGFGMVSLANGTQKDSTQKMNTMNDELWDDISSTK